MISGLKILLLVFIMADPLPKDEAKQKKDLGKNWVRPKQVVMVKSVQEAALQTLQYENIPGVKWEKKLLLLDLEANSINELPVPEVKFVVPDATKAQPLKTK
jgi:hypothetical protein